VFTPVLAKHSTSFSLVDYLSVGVDRMQRMQRRQGSRGCRLPSRLQSLPSFSRGPDNFQDMLLGLHRMDEHFRTTPVEKNERVWLRTNS